MIVKTQADAEPGASTVALSEETATIGIQQVATGRVRVSTQVETIEELVHSELRSEAVDVVRVAVNRHVTGTLPQIRTEGDVTVVPVFEEVLVVEKRLMLKEELHIRKRSTTETIDVPVDLRRQTATVERTAIDQEKRGLSD